MKFPKLFSPIKLGKVEIPNRIVMPPMTTNLAKGGEVTESMVKYYATRGRGGVGLIVVEDAIVDSPVGNHTIDCLCIDDDKYISGLRRVAEAIQAGGAKAILNLNHGGRRAGRVEEGKMFVTRGRIPVAPSPLPHPVTGFVVPRELEIEEIEEIEDKFARAARRVREAGFDGLSLHAAHMYLISEFLSPVANQRKDIYGVNLEGRTRFLLEILQKVKKEIGSDFPVMVRINGREGLEGSITIEDAKQIACRLEAAGVDCISLSCGAGIALAIPKFPTPVAPMRLPHGLEVNLAEAVKQVVFVPVMTANRIVTPQEAEDILREERADLIGIGRGLIADPEWPRKVQAGSDGEIRSCLGCMFCLKTVLETRTDIRCSVNAAAGRENRVRILPGEKSKTVLIAGGGPAGMEAARIAALRNHKVTLYEENRLGGQMNVASLPPGKQEFQTLIRFQSEQLKKLGVNVVHKTLTAQIVAEAKPDVVIVASGARPVTPAFPGVKRKNVVDAWQVLKEEVSVGDRVVILGGGEVGAETAEFLAMKGKQVTLVEQLESICEDMDRTTKLLLVMALKDLGVKVLTKAKAKEISDAGVSAEHRGKDIILPADTIVLALGAKPYRPLVARLKDTGTKVFVIGDSQKTGRVAQAIAAGFDAALQI